MKKTANIWEYKVGQLCVFVKNSISDLYTVYFYKFFIDGSKGAIGMHAPSHSNISFIFMQFSAKNLLNVGWRNPFWG